MPQDAERPDHHAAPSNTTRALRNSGYAIVEFAWPLVLALLVTPYVVHGLGTAAYGVLSIVAVTLGFFGLLDLGIGGAAMRAVAQHFERQEYGDAGRVLGTAITVYLAVGVGGAILLALLTPLLVTRVLSVPADVQRPAIAAFLVSAIGFPVTLVVGALASVPKAAQRFDLSTRVALLATTVGPVAVVAAIALRLGLAGVAVASLLVNLAAGSIYYAVAHRLLQGASIPLRLDRGLLGGLASFAGWFLLASFGVTILYQLDKLLLGALLSVSAVTYYVVPGNLANRIQGILAAATQIVFPATSALLARGNPEALVRLYRDGTRLTFLLAACLGVPMAVFARPFLAAWVGQDFADRSSSAMVLLVCTYVLLGLTGVVWGLAFGAGRAKANAVFAVGMGAFDIALLLLLVGPYQVTGAAAAYLASAALGVPALIAYVERQVIGLSGWAFLAEYARVAPAIVIQAGAGLALARVTNGLAPTVAGMAATAAALPILYLVTGLATPRDKALVGHLIGRFGSP